MPHVLTTGIGPDHPLTTESGMADAGAREALSPIAAARESRLRVAYVVTMMHVGGTELNALRTAVRLDRARFDIVVATFACEGPLLDRYRDAGISVVQFPITSLYDRSALREGLRLRRFLRDRRIDVVHCHDLYSNVFAVPWARLARVPAVIASRRWTHRADSRTLEVANGVAYLLAHRVLGNSGAVTRMLRDEDRVAPERILEVSNFVDEGTFRSPTSDAVAAFRAELGIPARAHVLGCVARLVPVKDHATLLHAVGKLAAQWPALHLVLVGDGERRRELESLATQLGISGRTHFAGYRPNEPNLHHMFDISVLASLSEGFPNSIIEAMAAGRPVVATSVGGNVDAVRARTGILVSPQDPAEMARAIERLLGDGALRTQMGQEALRIARAEYHADSVISRLEGTYLELGQRRTRVRLAPGSFFPRRRNA